MKIPIRLGIVGAGRGHNHADAVQLLDGLLRVTAVCDNDPEMLKSWRDNPKVTCYENYDDLLADPDIDAVCIATPIRLHAQQSIQALNAGKHVLCEVTAAFTLEECCELLATVLRSGRTYMMAENCCFFREVMMVDQMVKRGVFGEIISAEGSYIHDCRKYYFQDAENMAWRGQLRHEFANNWYPTHSLGPVCKWLGINQTDKLKTTATWPSNSAAVAAYARRNFGEDSPFGDENFWKMPDACSTLLRTEKGILIEHRLDLASPRPRHQNRYALQGTRASFVLNADVDAGPLIWISDSSPTNADGTATEWESLWKYADEYEHPLWREFGEVAIRTGHAGGDYFVLREFALAIIEERPPLVDVYDAVTWSSISELSEMSIKQGSAPVAVPDFKTSSL